MLSKSGKNCLNVTTLKKNAKLLIFYSKEKNAKKSFKFNDTKFLINQKGYKNVQQKRSTKTIPILTTSLILTKAHS